MLGASAPAEQIPVNTCKSHAGVHGCSYRGWKGHRQVEFKQEVQADEVNTLTYQFLDGSIDDEATTYSQQGTFRLVRDHHVERGPFFSKPFDFTVETATGLPPAGRGQE